MLQASQLWHRRDAAFHPASSQAVTGRFGSFTRLDPDIGFLLANNVRGNFLSTEFYTSNLSENNVYERIYDEVLLDSEFEDTTSDLLGDIDVPTEDIAEVAREIIPPEYLQEQVEAGVAGALDYLNKDTESPQVFIDLGPPLERVKPALFRYIDRRIDALEDVPITTIDELESELEDLFFSLEAGTIPNRVPSIEDPEGVVERYVKQSIAGLEEVPVNNLDDFKLELERVYLSLANGEVPTRVPSIEDPDALVSRQVDQRITELEEIPVSTPEEFKEGLEDVFKQLANGEIPTQIPSIAGIDVSLRDAAFDQVLQAVRNDPNIPRETIDGLEEQEEVIKAQLRLGNTKDALETASRPLTEPAVDKFVDEAYERAIQVLREDQSIPEETFKQLEGAEAEIKGQLRRGSIKGALEVASPFLTGPVVDQFLDDAYDRAYQALKEEGISEAALRGLDEQRDAIKGHLGQGDVKEALKLGARGLAGPLIDEALEEITKELDDQQRLDLVAKAAEQNNQTREKFVDELDVGRNIIKRVGLGSIAAILIVCVVMMGLFYLPHVSSSLRWPGLTLLLSGLVVIVLGLVAKSQLLESPLNRADVSPIPPSLVDIINDVSNSMVADVGSGIVTIAIVVLVIGLVMVAGSFLLRLLRIPFLSS